MPIVFKKQGALGWLADMCMVPLMYLLQGTWKEAPQRTHRWNNQKLSAETCQILDNRLLLSFSGEETAKVRWVGFLPRFHMPVWGGWRTFVVLAPVNYTADWHVGWIPHDVRAGVSKVAVTGPVRVTIGPGPVKFFGLDKDGAQIELVHQGSGQIGKAGITSRRVPLF
ncbi:MAG: hypothetical protein AAB388_02020 [Patescibacteria group bacterium]